jgi:hypothetical protein
MEMRDSMHLPSPVISNAQGHTTTKHASVCVYLHVNGPAVTVRMKRATYVRTTCLAQHVIVPRLASSINTKLIIITIMLAHLIVHVAVR